MLFCSDSELQGPSDWWYENRLISSQNKIIYEYIFDTSRLLQENASLANEFRISLVRTILQHGVNWKAPELRNRIVNWILTGAHVLNNDYQMIRSSIGQLLFNTLVWKDRNKCKLIYGRFTLISSQHYPYFTRQHYSHPTIVATSFSL